MSDYDSIGKGNRGDLYATLMSETFARDVNVLDATQRKSEDVMLQQTLSRVKADEAMRARLQGPTIKKEKFSSRYWSTWNKEKNLLEDLSYADMLNPPKNKSAAKEYKKNKRRAVHVQLTSVAPKGQKVLIFDIPLPPTRIKKQPFDAHLLGDTSVQSLLRDMHKMNMQRPTRPKEGPSVPKESSFDPEELGVAHVKGGAFPEFDRLPKNAQGQLTAKCDFAPFGDAVQANKGATFGSGVRFPVSVVPVGEGLAPLPEIKRPLPGGQFSKAGRFADKSSQGSVTVMVLVPPTEAEAEAEANAGQDEVWGNGTRGAVGRLSGVREVREEEELGGGDGDGGDGDAVGEFWDTEGGFREAPAGAVAGAGAGVGAGPVQTLPAQPKYTTFEYYPNDQPGPGHYQGGHSLPDLAYRSIRQGLHPAGARAVWHVSGRPLLPSHRDRDGEYHHLPPP
ncbi:hypothetical protein B484DRAFT_162594 [Ochromonadaceae sp. CCMP2298]|nr:hypothetical protein B484DRAFT_162594 [Ochromonadaceae sp. CCMP2298]